VVLETVETVGAVEAVEAVENVLFCGGNVPTKKYTST
jgi:hypothetical protein